jgi:hypothetical protein
MQNAHVQLATDHRDVDSLRALGTEAIRLLCVGDLEGLYERFGYALAFDRDPIAAIHEDLASSLSQVSATALVQTGYENIRVSYFSANETGLFALVECLLRTDNGKHLLLELIVTRDGPDAYITLEQLTGAA